MNFFHTFFRTASRWGGTAGIHDALPSAALAPNEAFAPAQLLQSQEAAAFNPACTEAGFDQLKNAYQSSGGIMRSDDVARLLDYRHAGNANSLADLIKSNEVFGFDWRRVKWVPLFQFNLLTLVATQETKKVLAELAGVFDDWTLAVWFVQASPFLAGRRPVDVIDKDSALVIAAASGDRLIAAA